VQIFCFLFPSWSLGTQLCRSSSFFGEAVLKPELGNEGEDYFEILASFLETQRVSAGAGGKLELPGQGVPKPELGNEGIYHSMFDVHFFHSIPGKNNLALMGRPRVGHLFTKACASSKMQAHVR
jgi:hypothetical protein